MRTGLPLTALTLATMLMTQACSGSSPTDEQSDAGVRVDASADADESRLADTETASQDTSEPDTSPQTTTRRAPEKTPLPDAVRDGKQTCIELRDYNEVFCTDTCVIDGTVYLESHKDVERLAQTGCEIIHGGLVVQHTRLSNLDGLEHIRVITWGVLIEHNDRLESIAGLDGVEHIDTIYVRDNDALTALDGFESLAPRPAIAGTDIRISGNAELRSLEGLANLKSAIFLWVTDNPKLADLHGLRSLEGAGWFKLHGNDSLSDLQGLENLRSVYGHCGGSNGGGLGISSNASLQSLDGLENLENVPLGVGIANNPKLVDISALSNLTNTGGCWYASGFHLSGNHALTNLDGFNIAIGDVWIRDNDALTDIDALSVLQEAQYVRIIDNDALTDVEGLRNLRTVGFPVSVGSRSRDGGLSISGNDRLENLDGLRSLGDVEGHKGHITIENNPALSDITGLSNLTEAGTLVIRNNDALESLDGLQDLRKVFNLRSGGVLRLEDNALLEDVSALTGLERLGGFFAINNPRLLTCVARAIARTVDDEGPIEIRRNDDRCP